MLKDIFLGKVDYNIIEISEMAEQRQIEILKKLYPHALILKENSPLLNFLYYKMSIENSTIEFENYFSHSLKNKLFPKVVPDEYDYKLNFKNIVKREKSNNRSYYRSFVENDFSFSRIGASPNDMNYSFT